jgi:hypothetical protein
VVWPDRISLRRRTRRWLVIGALVGLAACSSGSDPKLGATTSSSAPPGSNTSQTAEQQVLAGYRAFWIEGYLVAADPMDPTSPALTQHATSQQLETLQKAFLARKTNGEVIRGTVDLAPRVVSVVGSSATVRDCYLDNTGVFDATTGERHDTPTGVRHLITATLQLDGSTWKVSDLKQEGDGCTAA